MFRYSFSEIQEIDREILLYLDDSDLDQACLTNQWTKRICQDPLFWRQRNLNKYGPEIFKYKPSNETYQQQYQRLRRIKYNPEQYGDSIRDHHPFDEIIALSQRGVLPKSNIMFTASLHGNVELLNLLFSKGIQPESLSGAIFTDSPERLKWFLEHGIQLWNPDDILTAIYIGAVRILDYLFWEYNLLPQPSQEDLNKLALRGKLDALIWVDQHNLGLPDQRGLEQVRWAIQYLLDEESVPPQEREPINQNIIPLPLPESVKSRLPKQTPEELTWGWIKRYFTQGEIDELGRNYERLHQWMISRGI